MEVPARDCPVRDWQFHKCIFDFANSGYRRIARNDDPDLRSIQSGRRTDLVSGGFSLSDRWGRRNILLASYFVFFVAYLGFAVTRNALLIGTLFIVYGLYQGVFRAVGKALASDFVPEQMRASGIGWYNSTVGILQLVSSIVAGLLWDRISHVAVFYFGAVFAIVGSVGLVLLVQKSPHT